jgi:hypothetical protein
VSVFCPHFQRPVRAEKNQAIDRLVACAESEQCRQPTAPAMSNDAGEVARPYPHGCPVYPQLAK